MTTSNGDQDRVGIEGWYGLGIDLVDQRITLLAIDNDRAKAYEKSMDRSDGAEFAVFQFGRAGAEVAIDWFVGCGMSRRDATFSLAKVFRKLLEHDDRQRAELAQRDGGT